MNFFLAVIAAGLLAGLLYCEKKEVPQARLTLKSLLSSLFIFAAVVQPHAIPVYYRFLLIGMIFCLGGDIFLALSAKNMFLFGLVSFLMGHVFYAAAFFYAAGFNQWTVIGLTISALAGVGVFLWLRPHLESMKIPVICYMLVISVMVTGAWSMAGAGALGPAGRLTSFAGALGFYVSDIFVARQRFLKADFFNRLLGLPLYYGGQFMLAFSIGWMKPIGG
ncbi:MAG: lysoplasmalogenase [Deltaproteobacteria bacterium]|jgi:uncharacterized membrane protein YhhN